MVNPVQPGLQIAERSMDVWSVLPSTCWVTLGPSQVFVSCQGFCRVSLPTIGLDLTALSDMAIEECFDLVLSSVLEESLIVNALLSLESDPLVCT